MTARDIQQAARMALRSQDGGLGAAERFAAAMWLEERGLCLHRGPRLQSPLTVGDDTIPAGARLLLLHGSLSAWQRES